MCARRKYLHFISVLTCSQVTKIAHLLKIETSPINNSSVTIFVNFVMDVIERDGSRHDLKRNIHVSPKRSCSLLNSL